MVGRRWNWLSWQFTDKLDANFMVGRRWKWLSWQFTDKLDANFMVGRRWKWLSWQFTDKLDANLWSVDGESDCRDSLLTNSMQTYGR